MARKPTGQTQFLNVDLDLRVADGLDQLLAAMKLEVFALDPRHPHGLGRIRPVELPIFLISRRMAHLRMLYTSYNMVRLSRQ